MRWSMSRDGKRRTTLRVEHRLSRDDVINILCARALALAYDVDVRNPSAAWLENLVRTELMNHGSAYWPYWRDDANDLEQARVLAWAEHQADRLCPAEDQSSGKEKSG